MRVHNHDRRADAATTELVEDAEAAGRVIPRAEV
jgi:hypothetical protein